METWAQNDKTDFVLCPVATVENVSSQLITTLLFPETAAGNTYLLKDVIETTQQGKSKYTT